jgi:hypothetical protein
MGQQDYNNFFHILISLRPTIKFTMELEMNNTLPFLDVFAMKRGPDLTTKVYRKSIHTGHYLHFRSDDAPSREESCS